MGSRRRLWIALPGALLILLVALSGLAWRTLYHAAHAPGSATLTQDFVVAPGTSLRGVLSSLQAAGLVTDARHLEYYLRCCQSGEHLDGAAVKAGHYRIAPGQLPLDILRQLIEGRVVLEQLTIIEGWRFAQMRALVEAHPAIIATQRGHSDEELMAALGEEGVTPEGHFAPDTYSFAPGTTDLTVYRMAFDTQQQRLARAWEARDPDLPLATPEEALTLASVVEKETGLASERPLVAGVFINRLRQGMRLQSDPTVIYGMGERYDGNIRRRDLTTDTPYNTYTRTGLPPGPIALPGEKAILAALAPADTDAIFFVALGDGSGGHEFTATLAEHNRAVRRYLERLRQNVQTVLP